MVLHVVLVVNQARFSCYEAVRGHGVTRDGVRPIACCSRSPRSPTRSVSVSGYPPRDMGWHQLRSLGAVVLELCAVADGSLDAFAEWGDSGLGVWDYLGGMLVCSEAGAAVGEASGRELVVRAHAERRSPVAAASLELLTELLAARAGTPHRRLRR